MHIGPLILLLAASPVSAQQPPDAARALDDLLRCADLAGAPERLACYDAGARRVAASRRDGRLVVLDKARVTERRQRSFGLAAPGDEVLADAAGGSIQPVREVSSTIRIVGSTPDPAKWVLQLANGTVWQTVDALPSRPRPDAAIVVRRATMGGFRAAIGGGRSFLVKRLR